MNILAFLTDRRAKGSGKGKAASKLARLIDQDAKDWGKATMLQMIPRLITKNNGVYTDNRHNILRSYRIVDGKIAFTMASEAINREWSLTVHFDGAGGYEYQSIEGSLPGFAVGYGIIGDALKDTIDEAERTGFMDAQEAMEERLALP